MMLRNSGSFGPSSSPASRYAGIAERPNRLAPRPSAARTVMVTASSASVNRASGRWNEILRLDPAEVAELRDAAITPPVDQESRSAGKRQRKTPAGKRPGGVGYRADGGRGCSRPEPRARARAGDRGGRARLWPLDRPRRQERRRPGGGRRDAGDARHRLHERRRRHRRGREGRGADALQRRGSGQRPAA